MGLGPAQKMTRKLRYIGLVLAQATVLSAHAGVYGYVDPQGIIHLANHQVNAHYKLFSKPLRAAIASASSTPLAMAPKAASAPLVQSMPSPSRDLSHLAGLIEQTATDFHLDKRLLHSIISVESGYNPNAISPKGAVGLMQVMPATGRRFGISNLSDPQQNLIAGARYLRALMTQFNANLPLTIAAYNAGEGAVQKYRNTIPPFDETRNYVSKVLAVYQHHLQQPDSLKEVAPGGYAEKRSVLIFRGDQPAATEHW